MNRLGGGGIGGTEPRGPGECPRRRTRALVAEVTDAQTRRAHLVTERAFSAGCRTGRYTAMCGDEVLAASLTTPNVGYCRLCLTRWRGGR